MLHYSCAHSLLYLLQLTLLIRSSHVRRAEVDLVERIPVIKCELLRGNIVEFQFHSPDFGSWSAHNTTPDYILAPHMRQVDAVKSGSPHQFAR